MLLGLAFGIAGRFDRWVRQHNISPTALVAATAFLTVCIERGVREEKANQTQRRRAAEGDWDPPHPAG
jgi:hypothetical protein